MYQPSYYRNQAERARRLAESATDRSLEDELVRIAKDYDEIAEDLETGAIDIRELMPQTRTLRS